MHELVKSRIATQRLESPSRFNICKLRVALLVSLFQPVESLIRLTQGSIENTDGTRWNKSMLVQAFQFREYPSCFCFVPRYGIGKTEVQHEIRVVRSGELERLLKLLQGFLALSAVQICPAQGLVSWRKMGIQFQRFLDLLKRLVVTAGSEEPARQGVVDGQGQGVEVARPPGLRNPFFESPHVHQIASIPVVNSRITGIQLHGALVLSLGCWPIPLMRLGDERQGCVWFGESVIQFDGF